MAESQSPSVDHSGAIYDREVPPVYLDRLIVHKFDPFVPAPGGIDTCIRGLISYAPKDYALGIVGVSSSKRYTLGRWHRLTLNGTTIYWLPVARLDPGDQERRIPHSLRIVAGLAARIRKVPAFSSIQAHRTDVGAALSVLFPRTPLVQLVHTQDSGIVGATSDSVWRRAAGMQGALERFALRKARQIVVFNPSYGAQLAARMPNAMASPTWWDPQLIVERARSTVAGPVKIIWLGRIERPKNAALAVDAFTSLVSREGVNPVDWQIEFVGGGTLAKELREKIEELPPDVRRQVRLAGRLPHRVVMERLAQADIFLMTSSPGYEGFPRSLVEALATGLPAVVTTGSDTGALVTNRRNGFRCGYDPIELSDALMAARDLDPDIARDSVASLGAPAVIGRIYEFTEL